MRTVVSRLPVLAALALGLLAAGSANAQVKKADTPLGPEVHRMEIYNGPLRTVAYYNRGMSQGDAAMLRDLERAENEVAVTDHLLALRAQYAVDEQALQAQRRNLQMLLYGYNADINTSAYAATGGGPPYGYLGPWGGGWGWGGNYYGGGGYASAGYSADISHTLAVGMGDEGVVKNELAKLLATPAIPDLAYKAQKNLTVASARVFESPNLAAALEKADPGYGVQRAAFDQEADVVTLKGGGKVKGTIVSRDANWVEIQVPTGAGTNRRYRTMSIRMEEVKGINLP
jgi:hypothetical protein